MKKSIYIMALAVVGIISSFTAKHETKGDGWEVDKAHSSISFEINHFFTPVKGTFDDYTGTLNFDPENLEASKADFTINVSSVNTQNEKRDKHLQSGDFFNAKNWPEIKFVSEKFVKNSDNEYAIEGNLTIRDKTRKVTLPFKVLGIGDHMMKKGHKVAGLRAETSLNRNDFGVGTGSWAATAVVGDEVTIQITLEATTKK